MIALGFIKRLAIFHMVSYWQLMIVRAIGNHSIGEISLSIFTAERELLRFHCEFYNILLYNIITAIDSDNHEQTINWRYLMFKFSRQNEWQTQKLGFN